MTARSQLTQEKLKSIVNYDPQTGFFTWRANLANGFQAGERTGYLNKSRDGYYLETMVFGVRYRDNRLAFLWMTGAFPPNHVDHRNGDSQDNSLGNLRAATSSQNAANSKLSKLNKTGFKGVSLGKHAKRFRASIKVDGKFIGLGSFDTAIEAHKAYCEAAQKFFGEFARPEHKEPAAIAA